jgi:hypothetical protein
MSDVFALSTRNFFLDKHRTVDSKTQVPSFGQKKGPESPKFFQLQSFVSAYRQCLTKYSSPCGPSHSIPIVSYLQLSTAFLF